MRRRLLAGAGVLVTVALPMAACSDDGPDQEAFEAKVAEICAASGKRHAAVAPDFDFAAFDPATSDLSTIVPVIEEHLAIGAETVDRLGDVEGPDDDEDRLRAFIEIVERIHEVGAEEVEAAERGDREAFVELTSQEEELHSELPDDPTFEGC